MRTLSRSSVQGAVLRLLLPIGVLFGVVVTLTGQAAGQGAVELIASDFCQPDYWADFPSGELTCWVFFMNAVIDDAVDPAWSPDGSRLAFAGYSQPGIFILNLGDWSIAKVSSSGESPAWSPDGNRLAFAHGGLYVMGADGSSVVQLANVGFIGQPAWSPDGRRIAFDCEVEGGNRDICAINADGTGFLRLTSDPAWDSGAAFSPDGFAIAFTSNDGIAVMNPNGAGIICVAVGSQPAWSPDGSRIAYVFPFGGGEACEADGRTRLRRLRLLGWQRRHRKLLVEARGRNDGYRSGSHPHLCHQRDVHRHAHGHGLRGGHWHSDSSCRCQVLTCVAVCTMSIPITVLRKAW